MFNIGPPELIVVLLIALLVVGPKRLPEVGKTIGRSLREFRKAQDDLKSSMNFDIDQDAPAKATPKSQAKPPSGPLHEPDREPPVRDEAEDPAAPGGSSDAPVDPTDGD